jgi:glycosyltransferase involved in cell wall biosynthesis
VRIAFISQWFDPEGGSAAIPGSMVRALEHRGHRVEVVTGYPNYPTGKLQDGYRVRLHDVEQRGRTTVHRVALYPSHDRSAVRRMLNFLSFMISSSTVGAWFARRAQVALVYSTPATVGLAGVVLRTVFRRPFVLYIQDLWPDTLVATGLVPRRYERLATRLLTTFCSLVYRRAGRIAVISPGMRCLLAQRGVPEEKVDVIYNWVDENVFRPVSVRLDPTAFTLMYAGNLGDVQGLDVLVRAVGALTDLPDLRVVLVGDGVARDSLSRLATELYVDDRIAFLGSRPVTEMAEMMATADVQLVSLQDLPLFHATMPSKVQAILACGRPVVISAPGDAAELVRASGAGLIAAPGDVRALAEAIRTAYALRGDELEAMGRAGREFYQRELSASVGAARMEAALEAAAERGRR